MAPTPLPPWGSTGEQRARAAAQRIEDEWAPRWKGAEGEAARRVGVAHLVDFIVFSALHAEGVKRSGVADLTLAELAKRAGLRPDIAEEALGRLAFAGVIRRHRSPLGNVSGWVTSVAAEAAMKSAQTVSPPAPAATPAPPQRVAPSMPRSRGTFGETAGRVRIVGRTKADAPAKTELRRKV